MDLGSLLLGFALLLVVAFIVARPILEKRPAAYDAPDPAADLKAQREAILLSLRELDFDHTTGKITEEDYAPQRAQLVAEGAAILKQLDDAGLAAPTVTPAPTADPLEAAIAARRRAPRFEAVTCPGCGASALATDKFCPKCGITLALACAQCGQPARPGDKFCARCGATLSLAEVAS